MVVTNGHQKLVDLRSDTVTRPSQAMLRAVAELTPQDIGDDIYGEDATVNELQRRAAELTGKEAALFVSTGTQGNLAAILALCGRGDELLLGSESHVLHYEAGGISALGGVVMHVIPSEPNGELPLKALDEAIRNRPDDQHSAIPKAVTIEQTHNRAGGRVLSMRYLASLKAWAAANGLAVHMDGARVFNAAESLGVPVKEVAAQVDTMTFCLSKGLGAPVGSIIVGSAEFIHKAHRMRKLLGGAMRQVAVLAAPGLVALSDTPPLLAEDHTNAQLIAHELAQLDLVDIDTSAVESNIVLWHLKPEAPAVAVVLQRLKDAGFLVGGMKSTQLPSLLSACTPVTKGPEGCWPWALLPDDCSGHALLAADGTHLLMDLRLHSSRRDFVIAGGIRAVTHVDVTKEECLAFTRAFRTALEAPQ